MLGIGEKFPGYALTGVVSNDPKKAFRQFSSEELANLTLTITMINSCSRLNVAFRTVPGNYRPGMFQTRREVPTQRVGRQTHPGPSAPQ